MNGIDIEKPVLQILVSVVRLHKPLHDLDRTWSRRLVHRGVEMIERLRIMLLCYVAFARENYAVLATMIKFLLPVLHELLN